MGSGVGGAQVLLSSSCLLLLWHLNLSPCLGLPPALRVPGRGKTTTQEHSLRARIHPCGRAEGSM